MNRTHFIGVAPTPPPTEFKWVDGSNSGFALMCDMPDWVRLSVTKGEGDQWTAQIHEGRTRKFKGGSTANRDHRDAQRWCERTYGEWYE